MTGITYNSFVSEIATITAISSTVLVNGDNNFQGIMSALIDYVEGRLWRELDLPVTTITNTGSVCSSGVRTLTVSNTDGEPLVITDVNIQTPAGATSSYSTRVPLVPTSLAVIDAIYGSAVSSNCATPEFFYRISPRQLVLGPTPDQAYRTEITFTYRPAALSSTNPTTWLSENMPELMIAGGMIFAAGYMRDFGAQSDNPQMAQSWEGQYNNLMKSATTQAACMNFMSAGWTSQQPAPLTSPPRV